MNLIEKEMFGAIVGRSLFLSKSRFVGERFKECGIRLFSSRGASRRMGTGRGIQGKGPRLKRAKNDVEGVWYSPTKPRSKSLDMGRFGLKRLDYATLEPPVWTLPPQPPTKRVIERIVFPFTLLAVASVGLWVFLNPEEDDMRDYWERVETGQILVDDDDDDDDWDDEDED